jgi:hypothetical protein
MPITHVADNYLDVYRRGAEFEGGLAFQKALAQANLDFSVESLGRIDLLLDQIRERLKPEFDSFIGKQENQNFLHLIAFYAGEVIARGMGWQRQWLEHPELVKAVEEASEYPFCFATSITCLFENGYWFLPLSPIQERLFEADSGRSLKESAARYMKSQAEPPKLERSSAIPSMVPGPAAAEVKMLANFAGIAAAFAVFQIAEGGPLIPTLSSEMPSGERDMAALMRDDLNAAIDEGLQRLVINPEGAVRSTLAYDGFINLPSRRTDALVLEARSHAPHGFAFSVALPYRHARAEGGFALYHLRLLSFALDNAHLPLLTASFFAGFDKFRPEGMWKKYFDASL